MSDFLLSLQDVSLAFGGPPVLDKVALSISKGLRAALTGRNGEGKSTLLKVIAGELEPDGGTIVRAPNLRTIYVSQDVPHDRPGDAAFNALSGGRRRRQILEEALLARPDLLPGHHGPRQASRYWRHPSRHCSCQRPLGCESHQ